jgi:serine/threonine protein kinase
MRDSIEQPLSLYKEGDILLGMYRVIDLIGVGNFGEVYKVEVLKGRYAGQIVALKVARDKTMLPYLWKEAQTHILFNHPHILTMQSYLYKKDRGELFLIYEFMDVGNLKHYVVKHGPLEEGEALKVIFQVAKGLEFLHNRGYIHGDIKPDNIFGKRVMKSILWKLGDFSLLRVRGYSGIIDIKGTVGYIAPEVFKNQIHRSSDIFSLGCVLYFTLTGKSPFDAEDEQEKLRRNKLIIYTMPEGISPKVQALLGLMLESDHEKRFKTAKELINYMLAQRLL